MARKSARRPLKKDNSQDELMLAFLRNEGFEHTRDYVQRGRDLKGVSTQQLKERWVAAFKQMAATLSPQRRPIDPPIRLDIESELSIRGEEPPLHEVKPELEAFQRAAKEAIDKLLADPQRAQDVNDELTTDVEEFVRSSKHRSS
jgi:hypothetical protein